MYIEHKAAKTAFYILLAIIITWIIVEPHITLTPLQGLVVLFFIFFIHSNIEKRYIIKQYTVKNEKQNQLLDSICKYCPDSISYKNYKYQYVICNNALCNVLGFKEKKEFLYKTAYEIYDKQTADIIQKNDDEVMTEGKAVSYELRITKNGKETIFHNTAAPIVKDNDIIGILTIGRNITKKENLKKKLSQKHNQLITLLNTLPMCSYLKDINGEYIIGNFSSENSYFQKERIKHYEDIKEEDEEIIRTKEPFYHEKPLRIADGTYAWHRIYKSPILDKDKNVTGIAVLVKNIQLEKNIQNQRDTYVATLSHDLKTPTIAQIRALELLLSKDIGEINKDQEELLKLTLDSCQYMYEMVSTLLNTYKYENGETVLNYDYFDINKLTEECLNEVSQLTAEKEHLIIFKPNAKENIINADKIQIKRVIMNILSNSITYAYTKSDLEISIKTFDKKIEVCVKNESPYMPPEVLNTIFNKYVTHAEKFNKVGAGLGLYLTKQIIEAHNGKIIAKSYPENRCKFGFIIPIEKIEKAEIKTEPAIN